MVIDANVFGGVWFDTTFASYSARILAAHGDEVIVPGVWRSELLSIALYAIEERGVKPLEAAVRVRNAEEFFDGRVFPSDPALVLQLARERRLSTYDAEYVALAVMTGSRLITADRELFERTRAAHDVRWVEQFDVDRPPPPKPRRKR